MMIVNNDKIQAIIIHRRKPKIIPPLYIKINDININYENSVRLLGLEIDSKLSFDKHITELCKESTGQLNSLCKLKSFLNVDQRKILVISSICVNYNYCQLVWHICSKKLMKEIERIQYRVLQFLHNDYDYDYNTLLKKSDKCSMEVRRLRTMALEIFKSLNDLNPSLMKNLFNKRNKINKRKNDLINHTQNSVIFGSNSLRCLLPHIWNTLPEIIKEITSSEKSVDNWYGPVSLLVKKLNI